MPDFTKTEVVVASSGTYSEAFTIESWAMFFMAYFPAMDDGDIGLELSIDGGSNYAPVLDIVDGSDAVLCASGNEPGWIDFSDFIRAFPQNQDYKARFTCATQSSGAVTITVLQKGQ